LSPVRFLILPVLPRVHACEPCFSEEERDRKVMAKKMRAVQVPKPKGPFEIVEREFWIEANALRYCRAQNDREAVLESSIKTRPQT
jgi:hypothetical protein